MSDAVGEPRGVCRGRVRGHGRGIFFLVSVPDRNLQEPLTGLAKERKTGARGLRSIMESVLLDSMYKIPSLENVSKVIIDAAAIDGLSEPLLMFETPEQLQDPIAEEQG